MIIDTQKINQLAKPLVNKQALWGCLG